MEPLRVEFKFANLVSISDQPLHLDGLLAWAAVEQARRDGEEDLDRAAVTLPLLRRGDPKVWCASALTFDYLTPPSFRMLVRKTDVEDYAEAISSGRIKLAKSRDQLPVMSGPLRDHLVPYSVRQADRALAWCLGDVESVRALLAEIRHVGRYGRMGYGLVTSISVEQDVEAEWKWKLRHLPWREEGYLPCIGNYRAPYWDKATMTEVFAPPVSPIVVAGMNNSEVLAAG
jgi:CRISPR type IV-associated protein Csf3